MRLLTLVIDVERRNLDVLVRDVVIDANDGTLMRIDLLLIAIGRFGDLALEEAILYTGLYASERVDAVQVVQCCLLGLVGQLLDKVGTAQWIDGIDDAALAGENLLCAQGDQRGALRRQGQRLIERVRVQRIRAAQHGSKGLNSGAYHVVVGLLRGQRDASSLGMATQHPRARIFRAVAFAHQPGPQAASGAELGDLFKEVVVDIKEE